MTQENNKNEENLRLFRLLIIYWKRQKRLLFELPPERPDGVNQARNQNVGRNDESMSSTYCSD